MGGLYVWDTKAGLARTLEENTQFNGVAFSRDGAMLAASSTNGDKFNLVRVWDLKTGKVISTLTGPDSAAYAYMAFSPDGALLAAIYAATHAPVIQPLDIKARKALF